MRGARALLAVACLVMAAPAAASCRLALILALDVSSSVDADEYELQRLGLAAALDSEDVRHAILYGGHGHVALAVFEWSGFYQQKLHLDWSLLRTTRDIDRAVVAVGTMSRSHEGYPTAIGQALGFAAQLMGRAPDCQRQVVDISGDGINNYGFGPAAAYRSFPFDGITVNGLVILERYDGVADYYRKEVLRGPQSFLVVANGFEDFSAAMSKKLYREINDIMLGDSGTRRPRG
ncbi:DUF1194 domain-containing protein [Roseovarius sp.]|uniref:DUF1194 domain-containing protein n=1 Tax=Roseovarius sp. TaxID=1486281 RepID=UPI003BA944A9